MIMETGIEITETNFESETKEGVTLIDFWAPWCGPCRMQGPIVESVAEKMAGKAKVGKLNVDENQAIAAKYGVSGIPSLLIFKDGEEVDRLVGLQSEDVLVSKIESLL
jgi:thioredoxin 1